MDEEQIINIVKQLYKESLQIIERIISVSEEKQLTNTQEFIDFQDELNKLSIYQYGRKK